MRSSSFQGSFPFLTSAAIAGLLSASPIAAQVPINVDVAGQGNVQIGSIAVTPTAGINGDFTFAAGFAFLDAWYDFRWISVVESYVVNGVPQCPIPVIGAKPGIDPQTGQFVPGALPNPPQTGDDQPFYYNTDNWTAGTFGASTIHTEGVRSRFVDFRAGHPAGTVITFSTYLVVQNVTGPSDQIGANEFCILGGFQWTYTEGAGAAWIGTLLPNAASVAFVNSAIGNASPAFPGNWTAIVGCTLSECPQVTDCVYSDDPGTDFSESSWTLNGVEIGKTFEGGVVPLPGVPAYDTAYLPSEPNDWHWSVDFQWEGIPTTLTVWVENFQPGDQIDVEVICSPLFLTTEVTLAVDYGSDSYQLMDGGGAPLAPPGIWSLYPADIPPPLQFGPTGATRSNIAPSVGAVPALPSWALAGLAGLLALLGARRIRRR